MSKRNREYHCGHEREDMANQSIETKAELGSISIKRLDQLYWSADCPQASYELYGSGQDIAGCPQNGPKSSVEVLSPWRRYHSDVDAPGDEMPSLEHVRSNRGSYGHDRRDHRN
ncbi:hypothetical protein RvY_11269 [Ramazzottius varieornatus]|uniref:Uncharacterized protein n=1 Tax=Ramazzottius varieornatus TaxID=947166 RepID=A0A1D1VFM0_RAMVA|nr:hypothetical protein RvY_11269 [Ramazzottius varieornatus]